MLCHVFTLNTTKNVSMVLPDCYIWIYTKVVNKNNNNFTTRNKFVQTILHKKLKIWQLTQSC